MHHLTPLPTATPSVRNWISRPPLRRGFVLLICAVLFAFPSALRAVTPAPDGDYGNGNTAEGGFALDSLGGLTNGPGNNNTAIGSESLFSDTTGNGNTGVGNETLSFNVGGSSNTAVGDSALFRNTAGSYNTANGSEALYSNTSGYNNTASGIFTLFYNTSGVDNTANGRSALVNNTLGSDNTAEGINALSRSTTGSFNIALGSNAGANLTTGSNNIDIGAPGVAGESGKIRIGKSSTATATYIAGIYGKTAASATASAVFIDSSGHLGTIKSSARFKEAIKPMDKTSETLLQLEPVTFRYKENLDPNGVPQFGLIAEQVEKVNPDLVVRDEDGKVMTVRYEAVNAMLLNEFLKQHRTVQELKSTVAKQEATITQLNSTVAQQQKGFQATAAQQQKEIKALTASLKEQASQIQKVSAQLELSKPAPRTVNNQ